MPTTLTTLEKLDVVIEWVEKGIGDTLEELPPLDPYLTLARR